MLRDELHVTREKHLLHGDELLQAKSKIHVVKIKYMLPTVKDDVHEIEREAQACKRKLQHSKI